MLIDAWTGLPAIAIVEDPLAGRAVQVSTDTLKPVSALRAYGVLGINMLVLLVSLLSIIFFPVWALRRFIRRMPVDASLWVRAWPLLASVIMFTVILAPVTDSSINALGNVSFVSLTMTLGSILYTFVTLVSVLALWRCYGRVASRWIYSYACLHAILHVFMLGQLAVYGLIGIRTWV